MQLHPFVGCDEAKRLIETQCVGPRFVGRQLDEAAAAPPRSLDGVLEQASADAGRAHRGVDANAFDQCPPTTSIRQAGNESQLQDTNEPRRVLVAWFCATISS